MASQTMSPELEEKIKEKLLEGVTQRVGMAGRELTDDETEQIIIDEVIDLTENLPITEQDRKYLAASFANDFLKLGPLEPLLADDNVTEIMVNGGGRDEETGEKLPPKTFVEVNGLLQAVQGDLFENDAQLYRVIGQIGRKIGRSCTSAHPIMDARLEDGSRVLAVHGDVAPDGPCLVIRKFRRDVMTPDILIESGSCPRHVMAFLQSCVESRVNIFVSGGTGSGKTTLLNVLSIFIPPSERIITIENPIELQLDQPNLERWEARPANTEGEGEVTIHNLLVAALRARPDRIVVGEVRSIETIDMLQAMTTGHDGSLSTIHANDPITAFSRLRTMVQESNPNMNIDAIDSMVASAIELIVQVERDGNGHRHISEIVAVEGYQDGTIVHNDLFKFNPVTRCLEGQQVQSKRIKDRIEHAQKPYNPQWFMM